MNRKLIQNAYDVFAQRYDEVFLPHQAPKIHGLRAALPAIVPEPILDAGCGTSLVARLTGLPTIAVDISRPMLRQRPDTRRVQADLGRLPFDDAVFSVVLSVTALIDFGPELPQVGELCRVLKPGGWLAVSVLKHENVDALCRAMGRHGIEPSPRLDLDQDFGYVGRKGPGGGLTDSATRENQGSCLTMSPYESGRRSR